MIIKILFISALFFVLELLFILNLINSDLDFSKIDDYLLNFRGDQKRVIEILKHIDSNNNLNKQATYIFGGSTARQAFPLYNEWEKTGVKNTYNCGTSSQRLIDTIKLIDRINVKGTNIVYLVHPINFMIRDFDQLVYSKYAGGKALRYPVKSNFAKSIYEEKKVDVDSYRLKLASDINVHIYMLRNFIYKKILDIKNGNFDKLIVDNSESAKHTKKISTFTYNQLKSILLKGKKDFRDRYEDNLQLNFYLLNKLYELIEKKGLNLIIFDLPMSDVVYNVYKDSRELSLYNQYLSRFESSSSDIKHVKFNYEDYKNNQKYFNDAVHLNYLGREYFKDYILGFLNDI